MAALRLKENLDRVGNFVKKTVKEEEYKKFFDYLYRYDPLYTATLSAKLNYDIKRSKRVLKRIANRSKRRSTPYERAFAKEQLRKIENGIEIDGT